MRIYGMVSRCSCRYRKPHPRFDQKFLSKKMWLIHGVYVHLIEYNDQSLVKQNVCDFFLLPAEQFQAILGGNKSC